MEQITQNDLLEEYRVKYGIILKVNKYKKLHGEEYVSSELKSRNAKKKVKGLYQIYQLKKDITFDNGKTLKEGQYVYNMWSDTCTLVEVVTDPKDYHYEVKCSGGTIEGNLESVSNVLNSINDFINGLN